MRTRRAELEATRNELERVRAERDEYQRAAGELTTALERLRDAFDALDLGVVVVDGAGAEKVRNAEATRLTDARGSEAIAARALLDALAQAPSETVERIIELH